MVTAVGARVQSKKRKPKLIPKFCPFCELAYKGAAQSTYCSKYCTERACRRRKEALIEALAAFLQARSEDLTRYRFGIAFQIDSVQAFRMAGRCIEHNYQGFKLQFSALGYVYLEREKQWVYQPRLHG